MVNAEKRAGGKIIDQNVSHHCSTANTKAGTLEKPVSWQTFGSKTPGRRSSCIAMTFSGPAFRLSVALLIKRPKHYKSETHHLNI